MSAHPAGLPAARPAAPHLLQRQGGGGPDAVEQRQPGQVSQQPLVALQRVRVARVLLHGGLLLLPVPQAALREHQGQALQADMRPVSGPPTPSQTRARGPLPGRDVVRSELPRLGRKERYRLPWKTVASTLGSTAGRRLNCSRDVSHYHPGRGPRQGKRALSPARFMTAPFLCPEVS